MTEKTPAQLMERYFQLKDWLTAESKRFEAHCQPYQDELKTIQANLHGMLLKVNDGKPDGKRASFSNEHGTAYLSTIVTPKVIDREKFLDWVNDHYDEWGAMLQIGAPQKDAYNEYVDKFGADPPAVEHNTFINCNIRRS